MSFQTLVESKCISCIHSLPTPPMLQQSTCIYAQRR